MRMLAMLGVSLVVVSCGGSDSQLTKPSDTGGAGGAGGAGGGGGASGSGAGDSGPPKGTCPTGNFPSASDFGQVGPFAVAPAEAAGPSCTLFRPANLGEGGVRHPVIVWGNGTGTPTVAVYTWLLAHWATHGFIVAAANTGSAGTGVQMLGCLDWVESQNATAGSIYEGRVAVGRAGASGHSQGGGGTLMAGRDPRIVATVPFQAYTQQGFGGFDRASIAQQMGPMLLMSGSADTIAVPAQNQAPVFQETNVPVFWGTLMGSDHITFALGLMLGGGSASAVGYLAPSTAWFRLHLMCDESARSMFAGANCALCSDARWAVERRGLD
jgi:hypothetical protein